MATPAIRSRTKLRASRSTSKAGNAGFTFVQYNVCTVIPTQTNMQPFKPERLDEMFYWVREREAIRKAKWAGKPKPWTNDPILQSTRFCNVHRMDDKVSMWLLDNWYPTKGVSLRQQLANAGMARLINKIESLEVMARAGLNVRFDRAKAIDVMQGIKATKGTNLFTGAYIINGLAGQDKVTTVANQFEQMYCNANLVDPTSMRATHANLQKLSGIGSFIGGQIVADLRHVWPSSGPYDWADRHAWAPLGPGSHRGINWLTGWDGTAAQVPIRQSQFDEYMSALWVEFNKRVPSIMMDRDLEMHDLQNVLCETDKFLRIKYGTGRGKNKYPGV